MGVIQGGPKKGLRILWLFYEKWKLIVYRIANTKYQVETDLDPKDPHHYAVSGSERSPSLCCIWIRIWTPRIRHTVELKPFYCTIFMIVISGTPIEAPSTSILSSLAILHFSGTPDSNWPHCEICYYFCNTAIVPCVGLKGVCHKICYLFFIIRTYLGSIIFEFGLDFAEIFDH